MCGLNIEHMLKLGGIPAMAENAAKKSGLLYDYIDNSDGYYSNAIQKRWRSRMNVPFRVCCNADLEKKFIEQAKN